MELGKKTVVCLIKFFDSIQFINSPYADLLKDPEGVK